MTQHPEPLGPAWTYAQVNALEDRTGERFELVRGHVFAMSGETELHHDLRMAVYHQLYAQLESGARCKAFTEGLRIKVESTEVDYRYPDGSVFCAPRRHFRDDPRLFTNPALVFEVTSDTTAEVDHGPKVREYLAIDGLVAYVVVAHHARRITVYRKQDGRIVSHEQGTGTVTLTSELRLEVDALYEGAGIRGA